MICSKNPLLTNFKRLNIFFYSGNAKYLIFTNHHPSEDLLHICIYQHIRVFGSALSLDNYKMQIHQRKLYVQHFFNKKKCTNS